MVPVDFQEAQAVELKDKRVMLFARTYNGHPAKAYSSDGGETWSKGEMIKELSMPHASFPSVVRIPSTGDLLFVWGSAQAPVEGSTAVRRSRLSTAISKDEGKTFEHIRHFVDDPEDDFGYQCVDFLGKDKKTALIGFHARDGLYVAHIPVEWFYGE